MFCLVLVASFSFTKPALAAALTWDGGGADNNWTTAANWVGDVAPIAGDSLIFDSTGVATRPAPVNDFAPDTSFATITVSESGYTISGASVSLTTGLVASTYVTGSSTVSLIIGGAGSVTKSGAGGTLVLSGVNTFTGGLTVLSGTVTASTSDRALGGATGTGTVTIGDTSGSAAASVLVSTDGLTFANPIVLATGNTGTLTVGNTGTAISTTFSGGVTGTNNLTINENGTTGTITFSTAAINNIGTVTNLGVGTGTTTISGGIGSNVTEIIEWASVTSPLLITTTAITVNSAGTTITNDSAGGAGTITITSGVTGTGNLTISNDSDIVNGLTFTTTAINNTGTVTNIGGGVSALISGGIGSNVTAILQNSANSSLTIDTTAITVNSAGTTLRDTSGGTAVLTVTSGISGTGNLVLQNNSAVANGVNITTTSVNNTGTITNSGSGAGQVTVSSVIGTNVTGVTQNSATSNLLLSGTNTYTGTTTVTAGVAIVNGSQSGSAVSLNGGTLAGTGTVGAISSTASGGAVAPGTSPGVLNSGNANLSTNPSLVIELNGTTVGSGYDRLNVTGTVNVTDTVLTATAGFTPAAGDQFTIIANDSTDAVTGTFSTLAQNAVFAISGLNFRITYTGGTGNDVVLTYVGAISATQSTLTPTSASIVANGLTTQVLTVTAKYADSSNVGAGGGTVTITKSSGLGTIGSVTDNSDGTYTATVTSSASLGFGTFISTYGGSAVRSGAGTQTEVTVNFISATGGGSNPAPTISLFMPNGGQTWAAGTTHQISWTTGGSGILSVRISLSTNGGSSYPTTITSSGANGVYDWVVPSTATTGARIKIEGLLTGGAVGASDESETDFTITTVGGDNDGSNGATSTQSGIEGASTSSTGGEAMSRLDANDRLPAAFQVDSLVKLADDGKASTEADSTVYYLGLDVKRHPFVNSAAYFSWYADFSNVRTIDAATLTSIPLGKPILVRPGTRWVKIVSDPKTYYVEPGYKLRWIKDEATAVLLGGADWNKNIVDVDPSYFTYYTAASDINAADLTTVWPAGALVKSADETTIWYVTGGKRRAFTSSAALDANGFQARFMRTNSAGWQSLPTGTSITGAEDSLFSLLH